MAGQHRYSAFKNRCVTPPRDPQTKLPKTRSERFQEEDLDASKDWHLDKDDDLDYCLKGVGLHASLRSEGETVVKELTSGNDEVHHKGENSYVSGGSANVDSLLHPSDLSCLLKDDKKFYSHLRALRKENKKTLKILERLYNSHAVEDGTIGLDGTYIPPVAKAAWNGEEIYSSIVNRSNDVDDTRTVLRTTDRLKDIEFSRGGQNDVEEDGGNEENVDSDDSSHDYFQEWRQKRAYPPPNILPDEDNTTQFRGRHSSYDIIDSMWDRFSIEDYAPEEVSPEPVTIRQNEWKPKITIPKPFKMTERDSLEAKQRAKRKERIARELMQKALAEEAELEKKFKARPLPASTFLPLYEELRMQQEERREKVKESSKELLASKIKPFSFTKREEAMRAIRHQQMLNMKQRKVRSPGNIFKAQPFPEKLFDLSVEDKQAEQEEYRKIKMEMRAMEMLAKSSLPPNMKARGEKYASRRRQELRKYAEERKKRAKPTVSHDIPDFDALQRRFQKEMLKKRKEKEPTVCQPFNLQTAKIPQRSSQKFKEYENETRESTPPRGRKSQTLENHRRSKSLSTSQSSSLPYSLTETSRLRQDHLRRSREAKMKEEIALKEQEKQRRKREKQMQQKVLSRSLANDLRSLMKTQSEEKKKEFRRSDAARQKEYRDQILALKSRLDDRPLLFEREAQLNARRRAEKRYQQILLDAGVDAEIVDDLMSSREENGSAADSDSEGSTQTRHLTDEEGVAVRERDVEADHFDSYRTEDQYESSADCNPGDSTRYESDQNALDDAESVEEGEEY